MVVLVIFIATIIAILVCCCRISGNTDGKKKKKSELLDLKKNKLFGYMPNEIISPYNYDLDYNLPSGHVKTKQEFKIPLLYMKYSYSIYTAVLTLIITEGENIKYPKSEKKQSKVKLKLPPLKFESANFDNTSEPNINETFFIKLDPYYKFINKRMEITVFI